MPKKYVLKLTAEERAELARLVRKGNVAGWKVQRAQALLKCDQGPGGPAWPDARIAEARGSSSATTGHDGRFRSRNSVSSITSGSSPNYLRVRWPP